MSQIDFKHIAIIAVHYKDQKNLDQFIGHLKPYFDRGLRLVISDNSDQFYTINLPKNESIIYVANGENLGYLKAVEKAWSQLDQDIQWVVVANIDLEFGAHFFDNLSKMSIESQFIAPRIVGQPGNLEQNPLMGARPKRIRMRAYQFIFSSYLIGFLWETIAILRAELKRILGLKNPAKSLVRESIYAAHGACFILNKGIVKNGVSLHYPCFLYGEEIFLAEQCRDLKIPIIFDPSLEVIHNEHGSTGRFPSRVILNAKKESSRFLVSLFR
jgi:GT2 family glycosyltransferase